MKFLVTYRERRADFDPAAAQRRAARVLSERAMPAGLKIHELLSRIGGGGGYAYGFGGDGYSHGGDAGYGYGYGYGWGY